MEIRLLRLPKWLSFAIAVVGPLLTFLVRHGLDGVLGHDGAYVFFTIPVSIAALCGGFWPAMVATVLSYGLATYYFVLPTGVFLPPNIPKAIVAVVALVTWTFVGAIGESLRNAATSFQRASQERDEVRESVVAILDGITDAFLAVDNEWRIIYANQAFLGVTEREGGQVVGTQLFGASTDPVFGSIQEMIRQAKREGHSFTSDIKHPSLDKWIHVRGFPHAQGMFIYMQDVTIRSQIESSLDRQLASERAARGDAENASRLKDEFVSTLSHELRTPLTAIIGWIELITRCDRTPERLTEGLAAIERSARIQDGLIKDLLAMSRLGAGKLGEQRMIFDFREIVREAIELSKPAMHGKSIRLTHHIPAAECWVRGDASQLHQVVSNVLSNAVKFSLPGGEVDVRLTIADLTAVLTVRDEGEGIEHDFLPFVFDRFRQANASHSRVHGGLGLGLAFARQFAQLNDAVLTAESAGAGEGATFSLRLPIASEPSQNASDQFAISGSMRSLSGITVLVVDDDHETRKLLPVILIDAGANVHTAESAEVALRLVGEVHPDVILSDIGMPVMDGYEFIRRIRNHEDDAVRFIPALALTAFARPEDRQLSLASGFTEHLTKPIDAQLLIATLVRLTSSG